MRVEIPTKPETVGKEKEVAMSITKTINKIYKSKLYNEAINNPLYSRC